MSTAARPAGDRVFERHHLDPGILGLALAFDRLVVDAHPGDAAADAFPDHAAHRHADPAMPGVAVHDHRDAGRCRRSSPAISTHSDKVAVPTSASPV